MLPGNCERIRVGCRQVVRGKNALADLDMPPDIGVYTERAQPEKHPRNKARPQHGRKREKYLRNRGAREHGWRRGRDRQPVRLQWPPGRPHACGRRIS